MSLPRYFTDCPPFPSNVPVAELPTISLEKLEQGYQPEIDRFFGACRYYGFFLLDLKSSAQGRELLDDAEHLYDLTAKTFGLDRSVLDQFAYNPKVSLIGYKKAGALKNPDGTHDTTELYTLGQDDVLGTEPKRPNPEPIEDRREECRAFFLHAHRIVSTLISVLESQLKLPQGALADRTAIDKLSQTALRLLLTKPEVPAPTARRVTLGAHTDIGIFTLLFNGAGGLQILPPGSKNVDDNWRYIRPQPGCAVINIGDTLVEWTGGILRSSLHRVVTAPGDQYKVARHSFGYFMRPAKESTMRRLRADNSIIPLPADGDEDSRPVDEWAVERSYQILRGELTPHSVGGVTREQEVA